MHAVHARGLFVAHSNMPGGEEQVFRELRTRVAEGLDTYCNECELVAAAAEGVGPEPEGPDVPGAELGS